MKVFCHGTQWIAKCVDVTTNGWQANSTNPSSHLLRQVREMDASSECRIGGRNTVGVPRRAELDANVLREEKVQLSFFLHASLTKLTRRMQREGQAKLPFVGTLFRRHSDQLIQQKMEHRVAVTVCAVVTSFTITQVIFFLMLLVNFIGLNLFKARRDCTTYCALEKGKNEVCVSRKRDAFAVKQSALMAPSAVVLFWRSMWIDQHFEGNWYNLEVITSFLVIIGKCLNFVVFCLSSDNFRQKLLVILRSRCRGINEEKRCHSVITTYTRCDSRDSRILSAKKSFQSI
ncbi:hypothetical protein OSTOST_20437 [Ostertagia ostertagi]